MSFLEGFAQGFAKERDRRLDKEQRMEELKLQYTMPELMKRRTDWEARKAKDAEISKQAADLAKLAGDPSFVPLAQQELNNGVSYEEMQKRIADPNYYKKKETPKEVEVPIKPSVPAGLSPQPTERVPVESLPDSPANVKITASKPMPVPEAVKGASSPVVKEGLEGPVMPGDDTSGIRRVDAGLRDQISKIDPNLADFYTNSPDTYTEDKPVAGSDWVINKNVVTGKLPEGFTSVVNDAESGKRFMDAVNSNEITDATPAMIQYAKNMMIAGKRDDSTFKKLDKEEALYLAEFGSTPEEKTRGKNWLATYDKFEQMASTDDTELKKSIKPEMDVNTALVIESLVQEDKLSLNGTQSAIVKKAIQNSQDAKAETLAQKAADRKATSGSVFRRITLTGSIGDVVPTNNNGEPIDPITKEVIPQDEVTEIDKNANDVITKFASDNEKTITEMSQQKQAIESLRRTGGIISKINGRAFALSTSTILGLARWADKETSAIKDIVSNISNDKGEVVLPEEGTEDIRAFGDSISELTNSILTGPNSKLLDDATKVGIIRLDLAYQSLKAKNQQGNAISRQDLDRELESLGNSKEQFLNFVKQKGSDAVADLRQKQKTFMESPTYKSAKSAAQGFDLAAFDDLREALPKAKSIEDIEKLSVKIDPEGKGGVKFILPDGEVGFTQPR